MDMMVLHTSTEPEFYLVPSSGPLTRIHVALDGSTSISTVYRLPAGAEQLDTRGAIIAGLTYALNKVKLSKVARTTVDNVLEQYAPEWHDYDTD